MTAKRPASRSPSRPARSACPDTAEAAQADPSPAEAACLQALTGGSDAVLVTRPPTSPGEAGVVLHANPAFEKLFGVPLHALRGRPALLLQGPLADRHAVARLLQALQEGRAAQAELVLAHADGDAGWVAVDAWCVRPVASAGDWWVWRLRDLAPEKRAYAQLNDVQQRLRSTCQTLAVATFEAPAAPAFGPCALGPGAAELLGGVAGTLQADARLLAQWLGEDEYAAFAAHAARAQAAGASLDWTGRLRGGDSWVSWRARLQPVAGGEPLWRGVIAEVSERERERETLRDCRALLAGLAMRGERQRNSERRQVARQLHDELGQVLNAARMELGRLHRQHAKGALQSDALDRLDEYLALSTRCTRRLVDQLRPPALDLGLVAALETLRDEVRRRFAPGCELRAQDEPDCADHVVHGIYRLAGEAVRCLEALQPAGAIELHMRRVEQHIELDVRASGPAPADAPDSLDAAALQRMRELALVLGGQLDIERRPGRLPGLLLRVPATAPTPEDLT